MSDIVSLGYPIYKPSVKKHFSDGILKLSTESTFVEIDLNEDPDDVDRLDNMLCGKNEILLNSCNGAFILSLYKDGILDDLNSTRFPGYISSIQVVSDIKKYTSDNVRKLKTRFMKKLQNGTLNDLTIKKWIHSLFHYTHSASYHIAPLTNQGENRAYWTTFLNDEKHHWRIYNRIFKYLGWNIDAIKCENFPAINKHFIQSLHDTANRSEYQYACLLAYIEQGPLVEDLTDDLQFGSLIKMYNYPRQVIEPLWQHTQYNRTAGHEDMWAEILLKKIGFTQSEITGMKNSIITMLSHIDNWYLALEYEDEYGPTASPYYMV